MVERRGDNDRSDSPGPLHAPSIADLDRLHAAERTGPGAWIREAATIVVIALVISTLLRAFVVQVFWIPSPSMNPTLVENDRIAVNRVDALTGSIERGDVVVFDDELGWLPPASGSETTIGRWASAVGEFLGLVPANGEQTLVKRVIGVGGDRVQCCGDGGRLMVNGEPIDEPYVADGQAPSLIEFDVTVPEAAVWVMGDNRSNSADSRYHMGPGETPYVSVDAIVGTVAAVIWPFGHWASGLNDPGPFSSVPEPR
ncbi:signal peptidase I [Actinomyces sp. B33]|uniref:signal peptidase I n=1 Tax=Actinomyces sp. B33 TaxID=2942131 RepID=UPI002340B461|nr:signal peptidase I [Actinomyces sp. B33]MDC4232954.1 signal peptidase I [Actinomyces sp. B33]